MKVERAILACGIGLRAEKKTPAAIRRYTRELRYFADGPLRQGSGSHADDNTEWEAKAFLSCRSRLPWRGQDSEALALQHVEKPAPLRQRPLLGHRQVALVHEE